MTSDPIANEELLEDSRLYVTVDTVGLVTWLKRHTALATEV